MASSWEREDRLAERWQRLQRTVSAGGGSLKEFDSFSLVEEVGEVERYGA